MINQSGTWKVLAATIVWLVGACAHLDSSNYTSVSIAALSAAPQSYIGDKVAVEGFLTQQFENSNIWTDSDAAAKHQCTAGVGVYSRRDFDYLDSTWVRILGVFEPDCADDFADGLNPADKDPNEICIIIGHCGNAHIRIIGVAEVPPKPSGD